MKKELGEYLIYVDEWIEPQWVTVHHFREVSLDTEKDKGRLYKYFIALIDLAAEVCLQRNYKGIL